jgi:hypothetical protein
VAVLSCASLKFSVLSGATCERATSSSLSYR